MLQNVQKLHCTAKCAQTALRCTTYNAVDNKPRAQAQAMTLELLSNASEICS